MKSPKFWQLIEIILAVLVIGLSCFDFSLLFLAANQPDYQISTSKVKLKVPINQELGMPSVAMSTTNKPVIKDNRLSFSIPPQLAAKTIKQVKLSTDQPVIALTFDDGPWPQTTQQILHILKQEDIKATFFWIGKMVQDYPQIAKLVVADGHAIGNHTWHHWYRKMNSSTAMREIEATAAIISKTTGVKSSLFR